jgi:hypothetical protein
MTGFSLDEDVGGQFALSAQVTGHAHGASYGGAIAALNGSCPRYARRYTDAANRVNLDVSRLNVGGGDIEA